MGEWVEDIKTYSNYPIIIAVVSNIFTARSQKAIKVRKIHKNFTTKKKVDAC
jgi:hypothetical protein